MNKQISDFFHTDKPLPKILSISIRVLLYLRLYLCMQAYNRGLLDVWWGISYGALILFLLFLFWGLRKGKNWARILLMIQDTINLFSALTSLEYGLSWFEAIRACVEITILMLPRIRAHFDVTGLFFKGDQKSKMNILLNTSLLLMALGATAKTFLILKNKDNSLAGQARRAAASGYLPFFKQHMLNPEVIKVNPILIAAKNNQLNLVKFFVEQKYYHEVREKNGHSVLLITCRYGSVEMLRYLLENGYFTTETNIHGENCYDLAKQYNPKVYEFLYNK